MCGSIIFKQNLKLIQTFTTFPRPPQRSSVQHLTIVCFRNTGFTLEGTFFICCGWTCTRIQSHHRPGRQREDNCIGYRLGGTCQIHDGSRENLSAQNSLDFALFLSCNCRPDNLPTGTPPITCPFLLFPKCFCITGDNLKATRRAHRSATKFISTQHITNCTSQVHGVGGKLSASDW